MLPKSNCPFCHWSNFEHLKRFLKKNFRANEKKVLMRTQKKNNKIAKTIQRKKISLEVSFNFIFILKKV